VLSLLLVAAMGAAQAQPEGISNEMLRLAERCGEAFFQDLYRGYQGGVACEQGDPQAVRCGEFMTATSVRNASMAQGDCIERFYPKVDWRKYPVNGKYLEGYSPAEGEVFFWLSSVADCKAQRLAKQALDASPGDVALHRTLDLLLKPSPWPPKCEAVQSEAGPSQLK
jgi:hypothetical protein